MAEETGEKKERIAAAWVVLKRDLGVFALLLSICGGLVGIGLRVGHIIDQLDQHEKQIQKLAESDAKREAKMNMHDAKLDLVIQNLNLIEGKLQIPDHPNLYMPPMESEEGSVTPLPKPRSHADPFVFYETKAVRPKQDAISNEGKSPWQLNQAH